MATINGITSEQVKDRLKQVNKDTPLIWTSSIMNSPAELTARIAARNNIMLENVLANQKKIMAKLGIGEKMDVQA